MQGVLVHVILISRIPKEVQTMNKKFYKMRRNRMISGVLAGLSDKWDLDVTLVANPIKENDKSTPNVIVVVYVMENLSYKIRLRTDAGCLSSCYTCFKNTERGTNHE